MNEILKEQMEKNAVDRTMSCAVARKLAEDLHLSYEEIGKAADELGIRIKNCQLGCF